MSTGAMLCRQEQSFVDRSHVLPTKAILEAVPAVFCRQEQCRQEQSFVDKNILGGRSNNWGGLGGLPGRPGSLSGRPGAV